MSRDRFVVGLVCWWGLCLLVGLVGDPPAGVREPVVERVEEASGCCSDVCGLTTDVGDGSGAEDGVNFPLCVEALGGWGFGDLRTGVEDSRGVDPPDDEVLSDHIRTFQRWDRRIEGATEGGMEN